MDSKPTTWQKAEKFLAGKGFYIVLAGCAAVIGVSAWIMFSQENRIDEPTITVGQITESDIQSTYQPQPDTIQPTAEKPQVAVQAPNPPTEVEVFAPTPEEDDEEPTTVSDEPDTETLGFVWPVSGQVVNGYAADTLVYNKTMADWRVHPALDISTTLGTKVFATAKGTVETVLEDDMYGTTVVIDHGNGLKSIYSNLAGTPTVDAGDSVAMGAVIGAVGDTAIGETVEVTHLHFAMTLDGECVDPNDYLPIR